MMHTDGNQSSCHLQADCVFLDIEPSSCDGCTCGQNLDNCTLEVISEKMKGEILNPSEMNAKQRDLSVTSMTISPSKEFAYTNSSFQMGDDKPVFTIRDQSSGKPEKNSTLQREICDKKLQKNGCCRSFFCNKSGPSNIHLLIAELVGTGLLLFVGCMGCLNEGTDRTEYITGLAFGLTVMIIIQMFGHISGAHLNPAVTMVAYLHGALDLKAVPFYLLGQFGGAIIGFGGLKFLMPSEYLVQDFIDEATNETIHKQGLCTTNINAKLTATQGCALEAAITFVLIMICHAIWDQRNAAKQDSVPLRFGLVISAIAIIAGPFTGASMNTARSFAPALLNNDWNNQWIYWVGPTAGALIAHYFYKFLYAIPAEEEDDYEEVQMKSVNDAKV